MVKCPCPICEAGVELSDDTVQSELLECYNCGTELEVSGINPYQLSEAPQEGEDWGE